MHPESRRVILVFYITHRSPPTLHPTWARTLTLVRIVQVRQIVGLNASNGNSSTNHNTENWARPRIPMIHRPCFIVRTNCFGM